MAKYKDRAPDVLTYISQGYSNKEACQKAGISESEFYLWMNTKSDFSESVKKAQRLGDVVRINSVEAALLDVARGYEYEEIKTEYESQLNQATGKYEPTIKKQVRTKKRVVANTEAIKFYLSNKAPEEWKNRIDQNTTGNIVSDLNINYITQSPDDEVFPSSEDEVDATR
jgi:hypothetical protein